VAERSKYQQKVIKNYYQNREAISWQKLSELVTELYLAEGKKRDSLWKRVAGHLQGLGIKPEQIDHIVAQDDPQVVAKLLEKHMD